MRSITDPDLERVSGRFYDGVHEARAYRLAYDRASREQLRAVTEGLLDHRFAA
jgi:hypothetical protein